MSKDIRENLIASKKGFKTTVGSTTKKSSVVYIKMTAKITPTEKRDDYGECARRIKETFKRETEKIVWNSPDFLDEHICVADMSEESVKFGRRSFVKYAVYVKLHDGRNKDCVEKLASTLNDTIEKLLEDASLKII